jgi:hypothetical protein
MRLKEAAKHRSLMAAALKAPFEAATVGERR